MCLDKQVPCTYFLVQVLRADVGYNALIAESDLCIYTEED